MNPTRFLLACLLLLPLPVRAQDKPADVDWDKARSLHQREQQGEKLSADEQAYLDHAKSVRQKQNQAQAQNPRADVPPPPAPKESTGLVPLTQLKGDQKHKGVDGGLYGNGRNEPPEKLAQAAAIATSKVAPLGPDGNRAPNGRIVLLSIGMSNTTMEFSRFKEIADKDTDKSPKLTIVDGAQGGQDAIKWDTTAEKSPWTIAAERLKAASVTPQQVQAVWIKQALAGQGRFGEFPRHSDELKTRLEAIIAQAKTRYPNLKLVYLSSRIYAGYATTPLNPEPYAYEGAFSIRGVIDDEMKTDLAAPIILWGPYLWADGVKGRDGDKLVYTREDLAGDGTHPSPSGRQKVADLLLKFFKTDPTAKPWFSSEK